MSIQSGPREYFHAIELIQKAPRVWVRTVLDGDGTYVMLPTTKKAAIDAIAEIGGHIWIGIENEDQSVVLGMH